MKKQRQKGRGTSDVEV